jgi:phage repressor protein C with HTH and peptisase S24 domain
VTSKLQERLKEIAKECGGNRALCEKSGVSERTFANWLAGSSEPKIIGISSIANAAGVNIDWLVTGAKPKQRLGARSEGDDQNIQVALIQKRLSDLNGTIEQRFTIQGHIPFSKEFLKAKLGRENFDQLCILEVHGDSMEPTMGDGDIVLIDRNIRGANDGLTAYAFKDTIHIKRLVNVSGGIDVVSDNKYLYPVHHIEGKDLEEVEVIGAVIWIGKTILS